MIDLRTKDQTQALANTFRGDKLFRAKNITSKKLRKLIKAWAIETGVAESVFNQIQKEYNIEETTLLIEEWEAAVGIPDDCFGTDGTIERRRANVLTKLTSLGVSTEQEFIDLAAKFGLEVTISPGVDELTFPLLFPVSFNSLNARWVMVVRIITDAEGGTFPYPFPFIFGSIEGADIITCLFNKLVPVEVEVFFKIVKS